MEAKKSKLLLACLKVADHLIWFPEVIKTKSGSGAYYIGARLVSEVWPPIAKFLSKSISKQLKVELPVNPP
jgi:hypothetical protein